MKTRFVVASLVVAAGGAAADPPERDPGSEVRALFAVRCAGCHGPELARPKGRFGYVTDLRRVAGNPELVVPGHPDESELWELVRRGEMPPADSPAGSLSGDEKEVVRAWIAAGAPAAVSAPDPRPTDVPAPASTAGRLRQWLGNFHLLALHFPIALIVAAALGEAWAVVRRSRVPTESVRFCLWVAAVAAVPTVLFGWLHAAAGSGGSSPQSLAVHRWLGTIAGAWLILTAAVAEWDARRENRRRRVPVFVAVGALLTVVAAHFGGLLAHGTDFFDW